MSSRKKEPRYLTLFPQLIVVVALTVAAVAFFTVLNYFILRSVYLSRPHLDRVFDWRMGTRSFMTLGSYGVAFYVAAIQLHDMHAYSLYVTGPLAVWVLYLMGKNQALWLLGVIVDHDAKVVRIPPTTDPLDITDFLLVVPVFRHLSNYDVLPMESIEFVSRQAGKLLFLHGDFVSRKLEFSNKLKRDEALFLITSKCGISPRQMREID